MRYTVTITLDPWFDEFDPGDLANDLRRVLIERLDGYIEDVVSVRWETHE